jgi:hypothetical protein
MKLILRLVVYLAPITLVGCSALTIGVPLAAEAPGEPHPRCPWRLVPTVADTAVAGAFAVAIRENSSPSQQCTSANGSGAVGLPVPGCPSGPFISNAMLAVPLIVFAASAVLGWVETVFCVREIYMEGQGSSTMIERPTARQNGAIDLYGTNNDKRPRLLPNESDWNPVLLEYKSCPRRSFGTRNSPLCRSICRATLILTPLRQ